MLFSQIDQIYESRYPQVRHAKCANRLSRSRAYILLSDHRLMIPVIPFSNATNNTFELRWVPSTADRCYCCVDPSIIGPRFRVQ